MITQHTIIYDGYNRFIPIISNLQIHLESSEEEDESEDLPLSSNTSFVLPASVEKEILNFCKKSDVAALERKKLTDHVNTFHDQFITTSEDAARPAAAPSAEHDAGGQRSPGDQIPDLATADPVVSSYLGIFEPFLFDT